MEFTQLGRTGVRASRLCFGTMSFGGDGKVMYLGASNYSAWQVAKGPGISERRGWARFDVIQPMYSLVKRQVEMEILPLAVAWAAGHPAVTSPIIGARNPGQLGPSLSALDKALSEDFRAEISALSPEPAPATDRGETEAD